MPNYGPGGLAYWPPIATDAELAVASLSADGQTIKGWVKPPAGHVWRPDDLLWSPPGAKAGDLDQAGSVVDVVELGERAWVTAQLAKRQKYMDAIRALVKAGRMILSPALAKWLAGSSHDAATLTRTGTVAYGKSVDLPARAHRSWCAVGHDLDWSCESVTGG